MNDNKDKINFLLEELMDCKKEIISLKKRLIEQDVEKEGNKIKELLAYTGRLNYQ